MIGERLPFLEAVELEREPSALLDLWPGWEEAVVIDAVAGEEPGRIWRFDGARPLPARFGARQSTHLLGLPEVIELGRELGRLPDRLQVIGIEGSRFTLGAAIAPAVRDAAEAVAVEVGERGVGELPRARGGQ
jgi:hydrogenase maturation protease